ncbi:MAG: hypothetical protein RBG13Loki_1277 [Promethearchaeota archaeon CR_4]|nr:MAG: hypothetical protein RBG13Loki_1277 [Candidatus Lokiarchaeota archaeon CR_4]
MNVIADIDKEMVQNRLLILKENLSFLDKEKSRGSLENLSTDLKLQYSILYLLQNSIQIMIDIANHILARKTHNIPSEAGNVFDALEKEQLIPTGHAKKFKQMVKFRNLVIHRYQDIDTNLIYTILHENLTDFESFIEDVKKILLTSR